jgi:hypothetical protein
MTGRIILALMLVATIAGCARVSESRLNPFNWFGRSQKAEVTSTGPVATDPRRLVAEVISLRVEKVPGGAIINATGLPPRQGFYDGELILASSAEGVLTYEFRVSSPDFQTRVGSQQSREVIVGAFVSDKVLETVRQIRVQGATNALVVKR